MKLKRDWRDPGAEAKRTTSGRGGDWVLSPAGCWVKVRRPSAPSALYAIPYFVVGTDDEVEPWDVCTDAAGDDAVMSFPTRCAAEDWAMSNGILMSRQMPCVGVTARPFQQSKVNIRDEVQRRQREQRGRW